MVVVLNAGEADAAGRMLSEAIRYGYSARGWPVPPLLAEWRRLLARSAQDRVNWQAAGGAGPGEVCDGAPAPFSDQPARLTVKEAANLAEVSEGHMRRLIRRGDVEASRGHRSAWAVDIPSLAAWISSRRKEHDRKAA